MNLLRSFFLLPLFALVLAACGGGPAEVTIQPVDNEMKYAQTSFTVEAGQEVTIVFENTATSEAMHHNVVVLTSNDDEVANRVGQAAMTAVDTDYIPNDPAILAHTPMSAPGETVRVSFTAPSEPGTYRYICTYPGHYVMMQGTMTVT
ncbi:MAG: plastocyanin/azurin family copper-binding protein [Rhodothermales bacterium]